MADNSRLAEFLAACRGQIAGDLRDDHYTRMLYSTDASLYQLMPHAVLIPRNSGDVVTAVALAAEYEIPVLPRAAGTSLSGQAVNEALVIDFSRHLDAILAINAEERWARVQPGVVVDDLNSALRPHGLQFGPDPASSNRSTIGGAIANNATGSHSLLHGMSVDHVRAMTTVLSDGSVASLGAAESGAPGAYLRIVSGIQKIIDSPANQQVIGDGLPRYWRRCGGYNLDRLTPGGPLNLSHLVCGSEGTLAVMTEITIGLVPLPPHNVLALLHFDDVHRALAALPALLETGPSAVELLDHLSLRLCSGVPAYARLLASVSANPPVCFLVVEYQGESELAVRSALQALAARLGRDPLGSTGLTPAISPSAQSAVWAIRKAGLGLLMSGKSDMKPVPFIEDAAVPVEHLPAYVRRIEEYCAGLGMPITYYAHAGAGCLHIRPLINRRSAAEIARMPDIARFAAGLVKGYGGALSSEHGDGRTRSWLNESFYGPALYDLFRQVKRIFDPQNLFNPGIIVDAAPMTESLRALPNDTERPRLDFSDYAMAQPDEIRVAVIKPNDTTVNTGFVRAVEMCNGAGVCLQRNSGTMCPSYMVTREEMHSTRGRANALRAVMAGVLPAAELTGAGMYGVMDLCVSCKACKAECPSAVDMARLKTEFLARYYEVNGVPLRARFFGYSAALNRLGSGPMSPAVNAILRSAAGRRLSNRFLGLAPERPLPPLARETFATWWKRRHKAIESREDARVAALLIDPFTNCNYPEVGIAAVEFLEAMGVRVAEAPVIDDGRAFISKGLIGPARRAAGRAVGVLSPLAERGLPLIGLEPSSLLTLRDEYLYLLPGDPHVETVAGQALTFEEYVAGLATERDLATHFTSDMRRVLLHSHCHQKALIGTGPGRRILSLPPGYTVEEVDSGCCGMAGSFGYEAEHYAISMQMAERRLLPAIRAAAPETIVAASGVSCRQQIAHGSGRAALHPAQVLRQALR